MQPNLAVALGVEKIAEEEKSLEAELHYKLAQPSEIGEYETVVTPAEGAEDVPGARTLNSAAAAAAAGNAAIGNAAESMSNLDTLEP